MNTAIIPRKITFNLLCSLHSW